MNDMFPEVLTVLTHRDPVKEAVLAEREACAKVAEDPGYLAHPVRGHPMSEIQPSKQIAFAIRRRK